MRFEKIPGNYYMPKTAQAKIMARHKRIEESPCWLCDGKGVKVIDGRNFCMACAEEHVNAKRDRIARARFIRYENMRELVYDLYDKQLLDLYLYRPDIEAMFDAAILDGKTFDSAPEMAVAAMLVHNQIRCKPQYSIGKYRVDFYLPSLNVALEIDGEQHRPSYDAERDLRIRAEIQNYDFEILHIPVFYVQSNLASIPANIFTAAKKARKIRSSHGKNEAYHASLEIIQLRDIWNQSPKSDTSRDVK